MSVTQDWRMSEAEIVIDRGSDYAIIVPRLRSQKLSNRIII